MDRDPPKIYYASRTHSQLSQAVKELRNTVYRPKVAVLGSRDQLCINQEVLRAPSGARTALCRAKVLKKSCPFFAGKDAFRKTVVENEILDIEELVSAASKARACPYYTCKDTQVAADIIFLPYNYLIDPYARRAQNIDLENCIIIFDEGM